MKDTFAPESTSKIKFGEYEEREPTLKILPSKSKFDHFLIVFNLCHLGTKRMRKKVKFDTQEIQHK